MAGHFLRGESYVARVMGGGPGLRAPSIEEEAAAVPMAAGHRPAGPADDGRVQPGDRVQPRVCVQPGTASSPGSASSQGPRPAQGPRRDRVQPGDHVQPGDRVLVNGASGGVSTFAVQLAKVFGAHVAGVCSSRNVGLVRSFGADEVVDYTKEHFTRSGRRYDLLLDIAGSCSGSACRRVMTRKGTHVLIGGPAGRWFQPASHVFAALAAGLFVSERVVVAEVVPCTKIKQNLMTVAELIEGGEIHPVIDRTCPFAEIPRAVSYQEEGHASGKVVISSGIAFGPLLIFWTYLS